MNAQRSRHTPLPFTTRDEHARRVLTQLYRERVVGGRRSALFSEICAEVGIPSHLRVQLLDRLVREGYLAQERYGMISLTEAGADLAIAPRP